MITGLELSETQNKRCVICQNGLYHPGSRRKAYECRVKSGMEQRNNISWERWNFINILGYDWKGGLHFLDIFPPGGQSKTSIQWFGEIRRKCFCV